MNTTSSTLNAQSAKEVVMADEYGALAELVRQRMAELGLSTYEVARRSGNRISNSTVWNIVNDRVAEVKATTLRALARALAVPEEEIFSTAHGKGLSESTANERRLVLCFRELPHDKQEDLLLLANALHRKHGIRSHARSKSGKRRTT